ncbi:phenylalanine--tRNA ligase beta subunit, cytoplasmic-like [Durio zibethinus]|uniref:Phenylalanine--tRNA ligase beta subunit, cytoplasmic-like n=1 Tax=Durio zibethinus TaxID=66656 RepID=A0A6P5Y5U5_DURZI|nr:phenylalanine--tRNA ligase beta subunit, cytoplasmic-like [Durio zibethinus]
MLKMHVKKETSLIHPFVVCVVLRGITFDEASYNSFIDLQDKLYQNIYRKRTLVAIGTHDLDTLEGLFTYEVKNFKADELMEFYKPDLKLKKFLHILEKSKVFPVIYDRYRKFEVEPVEVISSDGNSSVYPDLSEYNMEVPLSYITGSIGVPLEVDELIHSLVDRIMEVMGTPFVPVADNSGYYIELSDEPEYLSGRQAKIIYKGRCVGIFGIVHPGVLLSIRVILLVRGYVGSLGSWLFVNPFAP